MRFLTNTEVIAHKPIDQSESSDLIIIIGERGSQIPKMYILTNIDQNQRKNTQVIARKPIDQSERSNL